MDMTVEKALKILLEKLDIKNVKVSEDNILEYNDKFVFLCQFNDGEPIQSVYVEKYNYEIGKFFPPDYSPEYLSSGKERKVSQPIEHGGTKGMKWGYNKGRRNGNRIAEGEDSTVDETSKDKLSSYKNNHYTNKSTWAMIKSDFSNNDSLPSKNNPKIKHDTISDIENDIKTINPNHKYSIEYQLNCSRCSLAYELRARGYDVKASPLGDNPSGTAAYAATYLLDMPDDLKLRNSDYSINNGVIKDGQQKFGSGEYKKGFNDEQISDIITEIKKYGGNRGYVLFSWITDCAHICNYEIKDGEVYFIDSQTGNVLSPSTYLQYADATSFYRTDDKEISKYALDLVDDVNVETPTDKQRKAEEGLINSKSELQEQVSSLKKERKEKWDEYTRLVGILVKTENDDMISKISKTTKKLREEINKLDEDIPRKEELLKLEIKHDAFISHIGVKGRSGRYPLGSGDRPYQSLEKAKKKGIFNIKLKSAKKKTKESTVETKPKKKSISEMTDDEIKERINRLQLETTLKRLMKENAPPPSEAKALIKRVGKNTLEKTLTNVGPQVGTYVLGSAINSAFGKTVVDMPKVKDLKKKNKQDKDKKQRQYWEDDDD